MDRLLFLAEMTGRVERRFVDSHNSVMVIDTSVPQFRPLMEFFQRCRIRYALIEAIPISAVFMHDFWSTAVYDGEANPPMISATIRGQAL